VGDTESPVPEMKDVTSTSFGYLIAFVLPGIFGIYALSYWVEQVAVILQPVMKADATVGPSFVFLVVAVGMGLCLSAVRYWVFEKFVCRKHGFPPDAFASLYKENKLTAFKAIVDEHYRYHQFYGGCGIALPVMFSAWVYHHLAWNQHLIYLTIGFVLIEVLLGHAAYDTFQKYVTRGSTVISENPSNQEDHQK
jgi:hypothetical protein